VGLCKGREMKYEQGDLIQAAKEGKFHAIVHGCNCFNTMGAGIAQQIKVHFPRAYERDQLTVKSDSRKLGTCQYVRVSPTLIVVNAYTQYNPGKDLCYHALRSCMFNIKLNLTGYKIGLPLIGCGIAGGDWEKVEEIISETLVNEDVTIMYLEHYFPKVLDIKIPPC
jgi:O-acetyl-ADP-ribose deacetylase (regulator of RNase III)